MAWRSAGPPKQLTDHYQVDVESRNAQIFLNAGYLSVQLSVVVLVFVNVSSFPVVQF